MTNVKEETQYVSNTTTPLSTLASATALPIKTETSTPQPTSTPTIPPTPIDTATPTTTPTLTPLPIESHTWDANPVLIQFKPKVCVDVCYGDEFSAFPTLTLYSDGLMIIDRQIETNFQLQAVQMSQTEVCALLNTIDLFGFLEFDPTDYIQENREYPRLQSSNYIEVNAWKSNQFDPGGLTDYLDGGEFEGELQLDPALLNTYQLLHEYSRQNLDSHVYVPDQLIVSIREVSPDQLDIVLFDAGVWPLEEISISALFERGMTASTAMNTKRLILEDAEALTLFELFGRDSAPSLRIYSENDLLYEISVRALLPYESMSSIGSAGEKDIIPGSDILYDTLETTCSVEDGVVDQYHTILNAIDS
jgi:hypothetical protein